ncbi:uncharacterized protein VICG_00375 [Vittaforma corneae ATCC 50505]|uniref:Uncharacterized protein n=1 Tax=Vittaforma corneae (strain ATCC 50505) TaxID=993615 RepID=L2GP28_VITCO|nr:uncharacterized protein VICG_00375 [Vittaforma corneae ATCC 50505]ELA42623.1 hypothetical protein VICG_00375 [Vittaforma corneae ATCC 50505]
MLFVQTVISLICKLCLLAPFISLLSLSENPEFIQECNHYMQHSLKYPSFSRQMKFTPVNSSFVFEPITTPNKNIQSYFMRSEQSFFTPENLKYPLYPSSDPAAQFLVLDGLIVVNGKKSSMTSF